MCHPRPFVEGLYQFPTTPYILFQPGLALLKDNPLAAIKTAADVSGLKIGYANGLAMADFLKLYNTVNDKNASALDGLVKKYTK
jgi:ABC-type amino acid transport substrate-binding protein